MSDPREIRGGEHLFSGTPQGMPAGCQPLAVWLEVCAGTMPDDISMSHLQHAAQCRDCGPLLAQANAALGLESTPEEQILLDRLETSSPDGQLRLAALLRSGATAGRKQATPRRFWSFVVPIAAWSAAGACIIAIAAMLVLRQPSDGRLLTLAYDEQRPSALRLPGTEPGPLASPTRGGVDNIESSHLLQLKLRTEKDFADHPNDPMVRQMLGRIDLVQHEGEAALRNFEMARTLDPNLRGLTFDLASAHFELAESSGQDLEYGRAINLFQQYLHEVGDKDPAALFNLGLSFERQSMPQQAISSFEAALAVEKDQKWRREIENHLASLRGNNPEPPVSSTRPKSLTPASFLSTKTELPGYFETFLAVATREWLPRRGTEEQIDNALRHLGALGVAHHDLWIEDMLLVPASEQQRAADEALALSLGASAAGNADRALTGSAEAMGLYRHTGNEAGYLRAAAEHIYSLQRMGLNDDCLRAARSVLANPRLARYAWLQTYVQLETAAAHAGLGDLPRGRLIASSVAIVAATDGLALSSLRAASFVSNDDVSLKRYASAWEQATAGLKQSIPVMDADMARFQLLSCLVAVAKSLHLEWTQAALADAAVTAAKRTMNHQTAAYALEELALDDLQIGDLGDASRSFREADSLLEGLGVGKAARRYAADWKSDRALLVAQSRGPAAATEILSREQPTYREPDAIFPAIHFYTEYADLLRQSHRPGESMRQALKAIAIAEQHLDGTDNATSPPAWPPESRKAYEVLVADLTQNAGDPELTLRAWEWLQSAPYRPGQPISQEFSFEELNQLLPPLPAPRQGRLTVVIAKVLDSYIAWSISTDPQHRITQRVLAGGATSIAGRADAFLRLCADPNSSTQDLSTLGESLYADLLAPFDAQIVATSQIDLDLDTSLASIPFAAMVHHGRYLGIEHPLNFLPNGWTVFSLKLTPEKARDRLPIAPRLVILQEQPLASRAMIPDDYDESRDIVRLFPNAQLERALLWRDGSVLALIGPPGLKTMLSQADVFHYAGHDPDEGPPNAEPSAILRLSGGSIPHCVLAVLAACRSLREREDTSADVPSFARIILAAGAGHVLATQWDVDSQMTRRLMLQFYAELAELQTFSEALRRAQRSLQSSPSTSHPYFWSGFQLVGNE